MGQEELIQSEIERIVDFYRTEVLKRRTRGVELLGRKCEPRLIRSFLGYELVLGKKRLTCPDMITARYLRIFAELGLNQVELPYDPTDTAKILPEIEKAFRSLKEALQKEDSPSKTRRTYRKIRKLLRAAESDTA